MVTNLFLPPPPPILDKGGTNGTAGAALRSARDRAALAVSTAAEVTKDKAREAVENVKEAAGAAKRKASEAVRRSREALAGDADVDAEDFCASDEVTGQKNGGKEGSERAEVSAFPETLDDAVTCSRTAGNNPGEGGKEEDGGKKEESEHPKEEGEEGGSGAVEPSPFVPDAGARSRL
jgi:hypothetical protein